MSSRKIASHAPAVEPLHAIVAEVAVAGLLSQQYVEIAAVGATRVFEKHLTEGKNYVFLTAEGEVFIGSRPQLAGAHRANNRVIDLLQQKGATASAAPVAALAPGQAVAPAAA